MKKMFKRLEKKANVETRFSCCGFRLPAMYSILQKNFTEDMKTIGFIWIKIPTFSHEEHYPITSRPAVSRNRDLLVFLSTTKISSATYKAWLYPRPSSRSQTLLFLSSIMHSHNRNSLSLLPSPLVLLCSHAPL
jgi:hypothetical protein